MESANNGLGVIVDDGTVQRLSVRLRDDMETGIAGAVADLQRCYRAATTARIQIKKLRDCIGLDLATKFLDDGFVQAMRARGSVITGNSMPYLGDAEFNARLSAYMQMLFPSVQSGMSYFQGAPARITIGYLRLKKN